MIFKTFAPIVFPHVFLHVAVNCVAVFEVPEKYELRRLSTTISNVSELIKDGYVYVDKTGFALRMIFASESYFLLTRPRRFGKTTFLSTVAEIVDGNKDLFNGTAIYRTDYSWPRHPVVRFDFSDKIACESPEVFEESLITTLKAIGSSFGILDLEGSSIHDYVTDLISAVHDKLASRVVILVDEYDYPYASNQERPEVAKNILKIMRTFYESLQSVGSSVELCLITGVTKLSGCRFSGWSDITLDWYYAEIAGFTQEEVELYFAGHIKNVASYKNTTRENILSELKSRYDGYRFSENKLPVYNSFTIISYFISKERKNFWTQAESSNVRNLARRIAEYPDSALDYLHERRSRPRNYVLFNTYDKDRDDEGLNLLETLLLQCGYLTIKKYDPKREHFKLGLANREIHEAFFNSLLIAFGETKYSELYQAVYGIAENLQNLEMDEFMEKMNTYVATFLSNSTGVGDKLSANLLRRSHLTNKIFNVIFQSGLIVAGLKINPSDFSKDHGGPNTLVTLFVDGGPFYLFELRLDVDPIDECIRQYKLSYQKQGQLAVCVGVKFDTKTARIVDWEAVQFSEDGNEVRKLYSHDP